MLVHVTVSAVTVMTSIGWEGQNIEHSTLMWLKQIPDMVRQKLGVWHRFHSTSGFSSFLGLAEPQGVPAPPV